MAMPIPEKTWVFNVNNLVNTGTVAGDMHEIVFAMKTAMVAAGWTVQLSSDATSAGAADYWIDSGDLNWGTTGVRSWVVLRNTNLGPAALEVLLECRWHVPGYPSHLRVCYAPAGDYAGGNTTTAPTCSNEQVLAVGSSGSYTASVISNGAANCGPRFWHHMYSTDGQCHRFFITQAGIQSFAFCIEKIKNPVAGLAASDRFIVFYYADTGNVSISGGLSRYTSAVLNALAQLKSYVAGSGPITYYATGEFCGAGSKPIHDLLVAPNPNDGDSWPVMPVGLVTFTNIAYAYGRNGEMFDLWWAPTSRVTGHTYPNDDSRQFLQLGEMIIPWDGSVPRVLV